MIRSGLVTVWTPWSAPAQASWVVGFQDAAEIQNLHLPAAAFCGLNGQLPRIRCQAQPNWVAPRGQSQGVGAAVEAIFYENHPAVSPLNDHR